MSFMLKFSKILNEIKLSSDNSKPMSFEFTDFKEGYGYIITPYGKVEASIEYNPSEKKYFYYIVIEQEIALNQKLIHFLKIYASNDWSSIYTIEIPEENVNNLDIDLK